MYIIRYDHTSFPFNFSSSLNITIKNNFPIFFFFSLSLSLSLSSYSFFSFFSFSFLFSFSVSACSSFYFFFFIVHQAQIWQPLCAWCANKHRNMKILLILTSSKNCNSLLFWENSYLQEMLVLCNQTWVNSVLYLSI